MIGSLYPLFVSSLPKRKKFVGKIDVRFFFKLFVRFREAGNSKKSAMSAAVRERTTTHTSRKIVSHGGPISGQSQAATTANSLENNLGKPLNVPSDV